MWPPNKSVWNLFIFSGTFVKAAISHDPIDKYSIYQVKNYDHNINIFSQKIKLIFKVYSNF